MKTKLVAWIVFLLPLYVLGQSAIKRPLDVKALQDWTNLDHGAISPDGKYVLFDENPADNGSEKAWTTTLTSSEGEWRKKFVVGKFHPWAEFTSDSKFAIIPIRGDSLAIVDLKRLNVRYLPDVLQIKVLKNIIVYKHSRDQRNLYSEDLSSGAKLTFTNVTNLFVAEDKSCLLIEQTTDDRVTLTRFSRSLGTRSISYSGTKSVRSLIFDRNSDQYAFTAGDGKNTEIWQGVSNSKSNQVCSGQTLNREIDALKEFTPDGQKLILSVKADEVKVKAQQKYGTLTVLSYLDPKLQTARVFADDDENNVEACLDLKSRQIQIIGGKHFNLETVGNNWALYSYSTHATDGLDWNWNKFSIRKNYLVSLKDSRKILLPFHNEWFRWSKSEKYVLFFKNGNYYSYEIESKRYRNLTGGLRASWHPRSNYGVDSADAIPLESNYCSVNPNKEILVGTYDLWEVSLDNKTAPVNLTNGYGEKHKIQFRDAFPSKFGVSTFDKTKPRLLIGFDFVSKKSGFFRTSRDGQDPERLCWDNVMYQAPSAKLFYTAEFKKADDDDSYLVTKQDARNPPNFFFTRDFKKFTKVSHLDRPENIQWLNTELHSWKTLFGDSLQGILFKPENFDSNKRYPVILYYYEQYSDFLNFFWQPHLSLGDLNIPWMVSRDYLVFVPDIKYYRSATLPSAFSAIESAGAYVQRLPYVIPHKVGLQGHSFGGVQTNFVLSRSSRFAAACTASGIADIVSYRGAVSVNGKALGGFPEMAQIKMRKNLWELPLHYINSSVVFNLNKVTTPVLIMHTTKDSACPVSQAMELYTGLRRLGKRSWLLLYDDEDHILQLRENQMDFTVRMEQFFDHYLKGKPAPVWMTRAEENGLQADRELKTPGPGVLTNYAQSVADSLTTIPEFFLKKQNQNK